MNHSILKISVSQYVCFFICLLLMVIVPINRYHKIVGFDLPDNEEDKPEISTISYLSDGQMLINTSEIGKNIIGYSGPTPVEIYVSADGKITRIKALDNHETPEFFGAVRNSDLLESLDGLTLDEAAGAQIDGVAGATFTSSAIIRNIRSGISYALDENNRPSVSHADNGSFSWKFLITVLVIFSGAIIPLFIRSQKYRLVQLILNVAILGFWGGTFVSYSIMVSALTNGVGRLTMIPIVLMLIIAFIYPIFGKTNHYCSWICPYGSLQDIAGKCCRKKITVSPRLAKSLNIARQILWFFLMWLLWTGLWFDWMGYEPFAAFFFTDASPVVLVIAAVFILLSLFVPRPYCRFVCPTGTLFKLSEGRG